MLENDKGMKKGISGYANSSPTEFNAESQPRATLCEDIPTDDVVARKTREFLDNGIEGMARQIGRRIEKQDLLGKYDSYYDKGLRKKKDVKTFQISELAKLDGPNAKSSYTELYPLAINVHLKAAVSQIQKDCNEIQLSIPKQVFDDLRKDFSAAKDKDGFKAAIEKFTKSAEQYGTMVTELDIGTDLQYILSIADKAFLNECERMLYKAASDDIARAKLDGLKSVLTSLDQLPSEEYQKRYEEARKGIRENSYMQALKKESEYHAAKDTDVLSLQKLYHETRQLQKANAQPNNQRPNRQSMTVEQIMVNQINESNTQPITTSSQIPLTKSVNQKPVIKHGPKLG